MKKNVYFRVTLVLFTVIFSTSIFTYLSGFVSASSNSRTVYLTFDDGPDPRYTPRILDILCKEHVHATFFLLGFRSKQYPDIVRRIHQEGHEIGNHGYYHTFIVHKSKQWIEQDISLADTAIESVCGVKPKYFRPPGGILSENDVKLVNSSGHPIAMWSIDTNDWKGTSSTSIFNAVKNNIRPNAIILFHDGVPASQHTVEALPMVIRYLRSHGYQLESLPKDFDGTHIGGPIDTKNYRLK